MGIRWLDLDVGRARFDSGIRFPLFASTPGRFQILLVEMDAASVDELGLYPAGDGFGFHVTDLEPVSCDPASSSGPRGGPGTIPNTPSKPNQIPSPGAALLKHAGQPLEKGHHLRALPDASVRLCLQNDYLLFP